MSRVRIKGGPGRTIVRLHLRPMPAQPYGGGDDPDPGIEYPAGLKLLWRSTAHEKSAVGPDPQYTGIPAVDATGIAPGHGPTFADMPDLNTNGTLVIKFTATKNSADIFSEEHIFGPIYADANGLICNDGTNRATFDAGWSVDDVATVIAQFVDGLGMRIWRV